MGEFFRKLFDTSDFPARWNCGDWSAWLGWLHIVSDLAIWLAYTGIPIGLGVIVLRRRDVPFPRAFWLFIAFITSCGLTHLIEAGIFYWPIYRVSGLAKLVTAVVSLVTMVVMIRYVRQAVRMPSFRLALTELNERLSRDSRRIASLERERVSLQQAVAASGAGLWDWSLDEDSCSWDARAGELLGIDGDVHSGERATFLARLHGDDARRVGDEIRQASAEAKELASQFRVVLRDGSTRHLFARSSVMRDATGRPRRMTGAILDVSEKAEVEALFRHAFESAPSGMLLVDERGTIRLANGNAGELFACTSEQLVGTSVDELVPERFRAHHPDHRRAFLQEFRPRPMGAARELLGRRTDGSEVPIEVLLSPVTIGGERSVISTITDITARKRYEAQLRRYTEQLESRNTSLDEFAYLVSHDLKAPLRAISMVSEWLETDYGDRLDEDFGRQLETMRERAAAMHRMIESALSYARATREEGELSTVDSGDVVREVLQLLDAPPGVVQVPQHMPMVACIREHLLKILLNLIGNALQHGTAAEPRIELLVDETDDLHVFSVRDNGPGIAPRYHEHVFRMFKRTPQTAGDSSGIGLAIVRTLVERSGGQCRLESDVGSGCTFSFTLPKVPPDDR